MCRLTVVTVAMLWSSHARGQPAEEDPAAPAIEDQAGEEQVGGETPAEVPPDAQPTDEETAQRLERLEAITKAQAEILAAQQVQMEALRERAEAAQERAAMAEETAALAGMDEESVSSQQDLLRIYGFTDVALTKVYVPEESRFSGLIDRNSSFVLGNLNVYFDGNPHPNIRALSEVRFSLFPHGNVEGDFERVDATTLDVTSATGRNRVIQSNIILERAWIEWKEYDSFKLRAGYFLTPYGIWNVDHGSPVLISSVLPTFWASEYFPTHQTGVQALGEVFYKRLEFGYRAYVSNGRVSGQLDPDFFKMFGGRVYVQHAGDFDTQVGLSGFWNKEARYEKELASVQPFRVDSEKASQYEEFGVAVDAAVDVGDLRLRSEFVLNQQEYADGLRAPAAPPGTFERDLTRWNVYGIAAYRLPFAGLEPFVFVEHAERPLLTDNRSSLYSAGVMAHIQPGTKFTFQAYYVHFGSDDEFPDASESDFPGWNMRLSTAF